MPVSARGFLCATVLVISVCGARPRGMSAQEYQVDREADNSVRFISRAPIEDFEGVTDHIDGYVLLDGPRVTSGTGEGETELYLEVDLASLDTGIGLRDRHMRDRYLEVRDFPYATYSGHLVRTVELEDGGFRVSSAGTVTIHGVSREMEIPCDVSAEGNAYRARCTFQVLLSEFDIDIPKVMFLKLAEDIRVELDFVVAPAGRDG